MRGNKIFRKSFKYLVVSFGIYLTSMGMANAACPSGSTPLSTFPAYITTSGTYCLTSNRIVNTPGSTAVVISASNVTLDFGGWAIHGPGWYSDTVSGYGVSVTNNAQNVTIQNGALTGFAVGIIMATNTGSNRTDGLLIDNMSIRAMGMAGVQVSLNSYCDNCTIRDSDISNVDANRITTQGGFSGAYGIYFDRSNNITITNNVITGVHSRGPLPSYGIYLKGGNEADVEGNSVATVANSPTSDTGILFFSFRNGTALNNRVSYFYRGIRFAYSPGGQHGGNTFYRVTIPITGGTAL